MQTHFLFRCSHLFCSGTMMMALVVMFLECDHLSLETCVLSEKRGFLDISKKTILPLGDWLVGCCAVVVDGVELYTTQV